jgi:lysophospholipase L1-like esterase
MGATAGLSRSDSHQIALLALLGKPAVAHRPLRRESCILRLSGKNPTPKTLGGLPIRRRATTMRRMTNVILAAFLLLGASIASNGRAVEPSTSHPDEWKDDIAAFAKLDADKAPPPGGIVFVGSSSIRMWNTNKSFPDLPVINRGFGGSQICDATYFADELVVKYKPRLIVFYSGDNDINAGKSAEQVHVDFAAFVAKVRKALPETPIVVISTKPSIARWAQRDTQREANRLIAADCEKDKMLKFVDVWPVMLGADGEPRKDIFIKDGLHMNDKGYELWTDLLRPVIRPDQPGDSK